MDNLKIGVLVQFIRFANTETTNEIELVTWIRDKNHKVFANKKLFIANTETIDQLNKSYWKEIILHK